MATLFKQSDFSGGLNTQLDAAKTPDNAYALLVNGRTRRNVIAPTSRHIKLDAPAGNFQGLYVNGSNLILFVSGVAYIADIHLSPILFAPVGNWQPMSSTAPRIYVELVPSSTNLFSRTGTPQSTVKTFNDAVGIFPQALFCFDGVSQPQAILPGGTAIYLGTYAQWTQDVPNYVPVGLLPAFASNKLFLASPDRQTIYHSVSGRAYDFGVNLDNAGQIAGDATTVSTAVALNPITAIRSLSSGQVLVGTLYGTHTLTLDYTNTIFGEPFLQPDFLFPAGPINEISIVDILQDTAFITQSGIHAFNVVAQAKRESNNYPLGAKIRGLLTDPITGKSITQKDTCAGLYDDFAFFAVNTIYGYGCVVYDTITQNYHSVDLSFGHVKQFGTTRLDGIERFFFITHDNEIFEAFADTEKNSTRMYFGEWTPDAASAQNIVHLVNVVFTTVRTSGQVKISVYSDRELVESGVVEVIAPGFAANIPIPIPFPNSKQAIAVNFQLNKRVRNWKIGVMVEWNFDGQLSDLAIDGSIETAENVGLDVPIEGLTEKLCFIAESGYHDELNDGVPFASGYKIVNVVLGSRYVYASNGNGVLVNGGDHIDNGLFTARASSVAIRGDGAATFSLRSADPYVSVLDAIVKEAPLGIIHGGGFAYPSGRVIDVEMAKLPLRLPIYPVAGNNDVITGHGAPFFNLMGVPRHYTKRFTFVDVFFFNSNPSEPDGISEYSVQGGMLKDWAMYSTAKFKLVVLYNAPYTNTEPFAPGTVPMQWINRTTGVHAVLSGLGLAMERFVINAFPYFVCGASGQPRGTFREGTTSAFRDNVNYGYLSIEADALTCLISFKDINGEVLDYYALYA